MKREEAGAAAPFPEDPSDNPAAPTEPNALDDGSLGAVNGGEALKKTDGYSSPNYCCPNCGSATFKITDRYAMDGIVNLYCLCERCGYTFMDFVQEPFSDEGALC